MSNETGNYIMLALNAYNAKEKEECIFFCDRTLKINSESADAKALKGAAILMSFPPFGAESNATEAFKIWKSISDGAEISDECKNIVINAAFDFRSRWYESAKVHHKEFRNVNGADEEWNHVKKSYQVFIKKVTQLPWLLNYPAFLRFTANLVKEQLSSLEKVSFAENVYMENIGKEGEIGQLSGQIKNELQKLKMRRILKWSSVISCILFIMLIFHFA